MSCCPTSSNIESSKAPKHRNCPKSDTKSLHVSFSTVLQHLNKPWANNRGKQFLDLDNQTYYFCNDADCDVVYFTQTDLVFSKNDLRTTVGIKAPNNIDAMACYCFDITFLEAKNNAELKQFVIDMTKKNLCACESQNPSGRCCLKDFPS